MPTARLKRRSMLLTTAWTLMLGPMLGRRSLASGTDDIVVIVHKDNTHAIDRSLVQQLYTGAVRGWPDGSPAFVLDQPEGSEARMLFCTNLLGRSSVNLRAIWAQNIFTGRGTPPKVAPNGEMKRLVAGNRHAIGYLRASQADESVRMVSV